MMVMIQFTEHIWTISLKQTLIKCGSQGSQSEGRVILSDILAKLFGLRALSF